MTSFTNERTGITIRPRRLRRTATLRQYGARDHAQPVRFHLSAVRALWSDQQRPIASMPGQFQWSVDKLAAEAKSIAALGIPSVIFIRHPGRKRRLRQRKLQSRGVVPQAIRAIKDAVPELIVISDMCFCEYTDHGHCGVINHVHAADYNPHLPEGYLLNDPTLRLLGEASIVHVEAGADIIAPSGMIDGMVGAIRTALDGQGMITSW